MRNKRTTLGVGLDQSAKNSRGITLIALIITIIIMLILVSVAVRSAINSGLFGHAKNAVGKWADEQNKETNLGNGPIEINGEVYNSIDEYIGKTGGEGEIDYKTIYTYTETGYITGLKPEYVTDINPAGVGSSNNYRMKLASLGDNKLYATYLAEGASSSERPSGTRYLVKELNGTLKIPNKIGNIEIIGMADWALCYIGNLENVIIEDGIREIR